MVQMEENLQALGRMLRKISGELGEEMQPKFNKVADRLEKGQTPDEVKRDLPDNTDEGGSSWCENAGLAKNPNQ